MHSNSTNENTNLRIVMAFSDEQYLECETSDTAQMSFHKPKVDISVLEQPHTRTEDPKLLQLFLRLITNDSLHLLIQILHETD